MSDMSNVGMSEAALVEAARALAASEAGRTGEDRRAAVCACGHTIAKHEHTVAGWKCYQGGYDKCKCANPVAVLKVPNARLFSYKTDESGHAVMKGVGKTAAIGKAHRLEWLVGCSACGAEPVTVVKVDDGRANEPRCGGHR